MPQGSTGRAIASERQRLLIVLAMMVLGLLFLGTTLYRVQVVESSAYADALEQHSIRRVRLPATRGRIVDRNGTVLADNRPSYCVALFVEELRQRGAWSNTINAVDALVEELEMVTGRPREISRSEIARHIERRRPLPLLAWKGLDERALARLSEYPHGRRGVDVYVQPERIYPLKDRAAHLIGYVGRRQPEQDDQEEDREEDYDFYLPDLVGRDGIEKSFDNHLAGRPGGQLIRVNAIGYKHEAQTGREPVRGRDVTLTIDLRLQQVAEDVLQGLRGAIVLLDCQTGEVLAMASAPRYDLSQFVPTLPHSVWNRLSKNPTHPLLNRATYGIYPPGSIYKPVISLAALDEGIITAETRVNCPGYYLMPNDSKIRCWHLAGHGEIRLQQAIAESCNTYFCHVGVELGYFPRIYNDSKLLGLGQRPDFELPTAAGNLPTDEWKRDRWGDGWRTGDTANLSIGQGFITATPLQMAVMAAAFANGGKVLRPRLVLEPYDRRPPVVAQMPWKASSLSAVRRGMYDTVNSTRGTGVRARIEGHTLAGKTGTAEYYDHGVRRKHAWMIAYGPFEDPRYAMAVIVENSDSGGRAAGPIVHHVFSALFAQPVNPAIVPESLDDLEPGTAPEPEGAGEPESRPEPDVELSAEVPPGTVGGRVRTLPPAAAERGPA